MSTLVLGKNGFVAKSVINYFLKTNQKYVAIGKGDCNLSNKKSIGMLEKIMKDMTTLIMPAAISPAKNYEEFETTSKIAKNVSLALKNCNDIHLILISSDSVYGDASNLYSENSNLNPNSFHGIAQLTREFIFQNSNLKSLAILRCSSIYGLEDTHTSYGPNRFFKSALQSEIIKVFGKGLNKRDHVYIDDVISIIDKVSKCKFTGVLNIASGDSLTFLEVANMVVDVFNSKSKIIFSGDEGDIREKNFDISKLINTFPDHKITELRKGLTLMKNQIE